MIISIKEVNPVTVMIDTGASDNEITSILANELGLYNENSSLVNFDDKRKISKSTGDYEVYSVSLLLGIDGDNFKSKFYKSKIFEKFNFNQLNNIHHLEFWFPSNPDVVKENGWDVLLGFNTIKDLNIL